jgi:hypothetical protein
MEDVHLIDAAHIVYDGAQFKDNLNCTQIDDTRWTYNQVSTMKDVTRCTRRES